MGHALITLPQVFAVCEGGGLSAYLVHVATEEITALCAGAGLVSESCVYVKTDLVNRKMNLCAPRIFVQAQFRKQDAESSSSDCNPEPKRQQQEPVQTP
jgi:hypothetical protein